VDDLGSIYFEEKPKHSIEIESSEDLLFPPTMNRAGKSRGKYDIKKIIRIKSDLFEHPTIITSDLHSYAPEVFEIIANKFDLGRYNIITAGDMAGPLPSKYSTDGDPTETYRFIKQHAKNLFIVQGNHDLPPEHIADLHNIKNDDRKRCLLADGTQLRKTEIGKIGGVHGTISLKKHPYKKDDAHYYALVDCILGMKPDVFITHDMPAVVYTNEAGEEVRMPGHDDLYKKVLKAKPRVHIFGHGHHDNFLLYNRGIYFINAEHRIIVFDPVEKIDD